MRARPVHTGVSDDLDVLLACLGPAPGKRFVTVSAHGAGEAALALVAFGADEVLALDLEAPEMLARLLALKIHAATRLGREDYLVTMGLRPALQSISGGGWFLPGLHLRCSAVRTVLANSRH